MRPTNRKTACWHELLSMVPSFRWIKARAQEGTWSCGRDSFSPRVGYQVNKEHTCPGVAPSNSTLIAKEAQFRTLGVNCPQDPEDCSDEIIPRY